MATLLPKNHLMPHIKPKKLDISILFKPRHQEPKLLAITNHSNCLHSATNHHDDTTGPTNATDPSRHQPNSTRPPSSLTTECEPCSQSPNTSAPQTLQ